MAGGKGGGHGMIDDGNDLLAVRTALRLGRAG